MDKRFVLSRLIRAMLALLGFAFLFVLFRSVSGPSLTSSPSNAFDNVVIGQTALRRSGGQRVWVTRLSEAQKRQVIKLNAFVVDRQSGCTVSNVLCLIKSESSRSGIDLVYSSSAPEQLPEDAAWFGGFVDPASGGVFDFMGRAYKEVRSNDQRTSLELLDSR